ncbi:MAG: SDR family oxidoreductase [Chitinophagaceae bacterium]
MKLLLFGASGATGRLVAAQAIALGHEVTAFVRNPEKIILSHPALAIVTGDVLNPASVDHAMAGHDAVLCCLGAPANKAYQLRSEGTKNILAAMKRHGVARFICQTSLGFADSRPILDNTSFVFKKIIVPFFLKTTFAEHAIQESLITCSDLNWTVVRPGNMTNGAQTGNYKHGFDYRDGTIKVKIARADVAHFMLAQLNNNAYSKKITGISY